MVVIGLSFSIEKNRNGWCIAYRLKLFRKYWHGIKVFNIRKGLGKTVPPRIVEADPSKSPTINDPADLTECPNPTLLQPEDM